jgi:hypothetical protein
VAGGFALCLALAPGTAWAEDEPTSPAPPEAVAELPEGEQEPAGQEPESQEAEGQAAAEEQPSEEPPVFELPPEVVAALQEFAAQAGFSEECVTGVTESLELIVNGVAGLPAELQQLVTDLGAAVQESIEAEDPAPLEEFLSGLAPAPPEEGSEEPPAVPIGGDIAAGLQQLADTLASEACQPAPPAEEPEQPAANPQQPPASYQPPQGPAAPAPQPPAQAVVYPGYAPTGAQEVEDGPSPAAIGLALAVLAGGAAWTGRRWRAARHDG